MIKENMYVRCSIETEMPDEPRDFATGFVTKIDEFAETAEIVFYDMYNLKRYYPMPDIHTYSLSEICHSNIRIGAVVEYNNEKYTIDSYCKSKEDGFFYYHITQKSDNSLVYVCESEISASFNDGEVSPAWQMKNYEFQNPSWYFGRNIVSETIRIVDNAVYGLRELSGCKIQLMPHQIKTVMRCLQERNCRYMLADEVGLGKTIEAISVLKIFLSDNENKKVLIVVPDTLIEQWKTELSFKFGIFTGENSNGNNVNLVSTSMINIISCKQSYDFVIIDEAHRLLKNDSLLKNAMFLSQNAENILMLSATPIQARNEEYFNLLKLIQPMKYTSMSYEEFNRILSLQKKISRLIHSVFDLITDYSIAIEESENTHNEETEDIFGDIIDEIENIAKLTDDALIKKSLNSIDYEAEDFGVEDIQTVVSYICYTYQLERCIIRNRNDNIKSTKRELIALPYDLEDYCNNTENRIYRLLSDWIENSLPDEKAFTKDYLNIVEAFFSSAKAFQNAISNSNYNFSEEFLVLSKKWVNEDEETLRTLCDTLCENPDEHRSRIVNIVDYIDQEAFDEKVLLFTGYLGTFDVYRRALNNYFGEEHCCFFCKGMSRDELELNAYRFQNNPECRIMLSDESGGEGRNFQVADKVIHIDVPWSANVIEQRIGRLDRIVRQDNNAVTSIVVYAENSLEEQLYKFWNEGVQLFSKSQPGLEIIMSELDSEIIKAVCSNFKYGLMNKIDEIISVMNSLKKQIKEERHFDVAASKYQRIYKQIERSVEKYKNSETDLFGKSMMGWCSLAGFRGESLNENVVQFSSASFSPKSAQNTLLVPPENLTELINDKMNQMQNHIRQLNGEKSIEKNPYFIRGTFDRNLAISNDYLHFFAPGDDIFDSIVNNALNSYKGRCSAFAYPCDTNWQGFVFSWYLRPNYEILLENGVSSRTISKYIGYLPTEIFRNTSPFRNDYDVSEQDVLKYIQHISNRSISKIKESVENYGQRHVKKNSMFNYGIKYGMSNLDWFKRSFPKDQWNNYVSRAFISAKERALKSLRKKFNTHDLQIALTEEIASQKAAKSYFGEAYTVSDTEKINDVIFNAFCKATIVLDSVCYIRLCKQ